MPPAYIELKKNSATDLPSYEDLAKKNEAYQKEL
jgi:hypothetical protein